MVKYHLTPFEVLPCTVGKLQRQTEDWESMSNENVKQLHLPHWTELIGKVVSYGVTVDSVWMTVETENSLNRLSFLLPSKEGDLLQAALARIEKGDYVGVLRSDALGNELVLRRLQRSKEEKVEVI